jgi:F-type H+-transporting ATPase subunit a
MPSWGIAMALPVIQVPGEVLVEGGFFGNDFTNTFAGLFLTDVVVILLAALAWAASKGWTNEIPGKFQAMIELLVEGLYNLVKGMAGTTSVVRNQLFPLVASIFFFLLIANWMELIPGVDSIGLKHCAHVGMNGYPINGNTLYNDATIFSGYAVTDEAQYEACHSFLEGHSHVVAAYDADEEANINRLSNELNAVVAEGEEPMSDEARAAAVAEYEEATGFHNATAFLSAEELERGILPYSFIVTPFIRAAATDLNLTFALAVISIIALQYFGVAALGPGYFQKFVNINALGNAGKRPMGLMDFGVGLFEIVSEISKVISLSFRLFGNIFAGQLLLFILTFLVATLLPVAIYGLEFAVGMIQALVFGMLTLVFSAQAMVSHAHDEEEHH